MEITELIRTDENEWKLAAHNIAWREVVEMIDRDDWVPARHPLYPEQVRVIGRAATGRWITVVLDPTDDEVVWRPVTGWPSEEHEIAYYLEDNR